LAKKVIRITKNQLIDVAIQSIRQKNSLSMFWEYVEQARASGLLSMSDEKIKLLVSTYENTIYDRGFEKQEQDKKLSSDVSTSSIGDSSYRSRIVEGSPFDNLLAKTIDITPLRKEIPDYMSVIQPRPDKVYLIDRLVFWPLFKVVGVFTPDRTTYQLYLIGRDRHTNQPFALGIPAGFIDQPFEACLRWTLDAHKGDTVIEV